MEFDEFDGEGVGDGAVEAGGEEAGLTDDAAAGRPLPLPPTLETPLVNAAGYIGRYSGPAGSFEIRAGSPLTILADGQSAPLQSGEPDLFRTRHPALRAFTLKFEKTGSKIEESAGETIPIGGAGLIVAYPHEAAGKVEPAVTRSIKHVVGEAEGHHVKALKAALADAQQKMAEEGG